MNERWKEIRGNREIYEISNFGNVRTKDRIGARGYKVKGHILAQHDNSNGYLRVGINIDGKPESKLVHRLVAENFIPKVDGKDYINHKDGNKHNNHYTNLEWCTKSENESHAWKSGLKNREKHAHNGESHPMHKLSKEEVVYIRNNHKPYDKYFGSVPLGKRFGVSAQTIINIVHNKNWKNGK